MATTTRKSKTPTTSEQVVKLRTKLNMSQKQFAEAIGCSMGTLHRLETDGPTTANHTELLTKAMELTPSEEMAQRGRPAVPVDEKAVELLNSIKEKQGLSLAALGEKIGYSGPMTHSFLAGKRGIPESVKDAMAKLNKKSAKVAAK